jgi:hypothetical protein
MKGRGFTLTIVLILAAAMFSSNLVTDSSNDLSGRNTVEWINPATGQHIVREIDDEGNIVCARQCNFREGCGLGEKCVKYNCRNAEILEYGTYCKSDRDVSQRQSF